MIPTRVIEELKLVRVRQIMVEGFGGDIHMADTFIIAIQIHDLPEIAAEVITHANERFVLLGRDVLNQLRIVLDGPR